jgi:uncharacterized protein (DUF952 family)
MTSALCGGMTDNGIQIVYKIAGSAEWATAEVADVYLGSQDDARDGFIHFSTAAQAAMTAAKYFSARDDLVIVAVDVAALGIKLMWEPSRGGDMFPHLYGPLAMAAVRWMKPLPLGPDGRHQFPEEMI